MARAPRNYADEYKATHGTPKGLKDRASRNKARREFMKKGLVHKGDGKEVDHKNMNPRDDKMKNLQVLSRHANRIKQPSRGGKK
jgi:hypothetical protein